MIKPFKIRTVNASHSREIQEWLFSLGYRWWNGTKNVLELKATFLFFGEDPGGIKPTLTYGTRARFYELENLPEAWFYDGKLQDKPKEESTMKLKPFKIKVVNESHSKEIQEWLFSLGYSWLGDTKTYQTGAKFLFLETNSYEDDLKLTYGLSDSFFEEKDLPEAWFYVGKIHYEPKPQTLPEFKIKVESPEHSRKLQEFLFSMGCSWSTPKKIDQEVRNLDYKYLYLENTRKEPIPRLAITSTGFFDKIDLPEMWFYGGKLRNEPSQLEPQPQPQTKPQKVETAISNKKTYRQVGEAILSGQKLQFLDSSGDWISLNYMGLHALQLDREFPHEVRVKPRICNNVELDPCVVTEPEMESAYYYPDPTLPYFCDTTSWIGLNKDKHLLKSGMIYLNAKSAAKHGKAMVITYDN